MPLSVVVAVLVHVPDPKHGLAWYEKAFPLATRETATDDGFEFLQLGTLQIEVVQADEKVASGPSGTVVYWKVENLTEELIRLQKLGAKLYRGPMRIEEGQSMCQIQDPWGNCLGLRGPAL